MRAPRPSQLERGLYGLCVMSTMCNIHDAVSYGQRINPAATMLLIYVGKETRKGWGRGLTKCFQSGQPHGPHPGRQLRDDSFIPRLYDTDYDLALAGLHMHASWLWCGSRQVSSGSCLSSSFCCVGSMDRTPIRSPTEAVSQQASIGWLCRIGVSRSCIEGG